MTRLGPAHPGYGFERHMGYSVPEHFAALARLGPTIHHRRSFAPVAAKLAALGGASDEVDGRVVASLARLLYLCIAAGSCRLRVTNHPVAGQCITSP